MKQSPPPTSPSKIPLPSPTDTNFYESDVEDIPEPPIEPPLPRPHVPFQIQLARPYGSPRRLPPEILSLIFNFLLASQTIVIRNSQPNVDVLWTSARGVNVRVDENDFEGYPLGSTPTRSDIEPSSRPITYNRPSRIQRTRNICALARADTRNYKRSFIQVLNGNSTRGVWYRAERDVIFFESNSAFHRFIGETHRVTPSLTGQGFEDLVTAHTGIQTVYLLYAVPFIDPRDPDYHSDYFGNPFRYLSTFLDLNRLAIAAPDGEMRRRGGNGRIAGQRALILDIMRSYVEESGRTFNPPPIVFVGADSLRELVNRDVRVEPRRSSAISPDEKGDPAQAPAGEASGSREAGSGPFAVERDGSRTVSRTAANQGTADQQQDPIDKEQGQDETPQQTIKRLDDEDRKLRKQKEECDKQTKKLRGELEQERQVVAEFLAREKATSEKCKVEKEDLIRQLQEMTQNRDNLLPGNDEPAPQSAGKETPEQRLSRLENENMTIRQQKQQGDNARYQRIAALVAEVSRLDKKNKELLGQQREAEANCEQEKDALAQQLTQRLQEMAQDMDDLLAGRVDGRKDSWDREGAEPGLTVERLRERIKRCEDAKEELRVSKEESEDDRDRNITALVVEISRLAAEKQAADAECEREKAALRALVDSQEALDEQAELRTTIESLKQERDTLAAEFENQKEIARVYVLRVLEESKEDDERCEAKLEEQRAAFAAERERLEQEITKLQATIQEREQELATSNATCKVDKANLNGRIDVLKQEIFELEEDSENTKKRIEALINSGATSLGKNDTLQSEINKLRAELKDLRDGIALADQERADTREIAHQQVNEAMRRKAEVPFLEVAAGLQEQIKTAEREHQATRAVMAQSQRDAAEAKAKAEKEFAERKAILDDIIIGHEAEIVDLREQLMISRATEERQAIQQELDRRNEELEELREQMDSTVKQMEERAATAKKDAENVSRYNILDLENQYTNIKRQFMDRMRDQIAYLNREIRVVELRIESKKKRAAIKASFGTPFAPGRPRFKVPYAKSAM